MPRHLYPNRCPKTGWELNRKAISSWFVWEVYRLDGEGYSHDRKEFFRRRDAMAHFIKMITEAAQ